MIDSSRTVTIAGGGVAGFAAALCLADKGFRVDIIEKAEALESVGAGLQVSPNAFHVLDRLGLGRALKTVATAPLAIRVMNAISGRQITTIPLGETAIARYGAPYVALHRADLLQVLAGAAADHPDIAIHMGRRVEGAASHVNGVTSLVYDNGALEEFHGLALIAADGVWSKLRKLNFGAADATYTGLIAWRGLIPMDILQASQDKENVQLWLSPDAHAVSYPIRQGKYLNFVAVTAAPFGLEGSQLGWADESNAEALVGELSRWHSSVLDTLSHRARWTKWPLYAVPQLATWSHRSIALCGDAAHAMLPFSAQGAAMAIEDAAVLAECLAGAQKSEVPAALERYGHIRRSRVGRAAKLTLANRTIYHLGQPLAAARNLVMNSMGGERLLARQDWLYGWKLET